MKEKEKKIIFPIIVMVFTFFVLILGSTYAYFTTDNKASGKTNVNTEFASVGISKLAAKNNLILNLSLVNMMQQNDNIAYYATLDGVPSTSDPQISIAEASVDGNGKMNCNYIIKVNVSGTNNMYTAFTNMSTKSTNQLILNVAGTDYDLHEVTFPLTISGTIENLEENNNQNILASFRIINRKDVDQSTLANKDLTLDFSVSSYACTLVG